jgi:hypothetical protein
VTYERTVEKLNKAGEVVARITEVRYQPPDWRADAWHLERSRPQTWGQRRCLDAETSVRRAAAKVAAEATAAGIPMTADDRDPHRPLSPAQPCGQAMRRPCPAP